LLFSAAYVTWLLCWLLSLTLFRLDVPQTRTHGWKKLPRSTSYYNN